MAVTSVIQPQPQQQSFLSPRRSYSTGEITVKQMTTVNPFPAFPQQQQLTLPSHKSNSGGEKQDQPLYTLLETPVIQQQPPQQLISSPPRSNSTGEIRQLYQPPPLQPLQFMSPSHMSSSREQLREKEQLVTHLQEELRENELEKANLLMEKDELKENLERELSETEEELTNVKEQLREKEQQLINSSSQLNEMTQQSRNFQMQLQQTQFWGFNLQKELNGKQQQLQNTEGQLREVRQQLTNVQGNLRQKNEETANLQNQVSTLEEQLRAKDREMNELEISLSTVQQELNECQQQQSPDWVISRDQIQLTDKLLGRGGWGSVVEGRYCGCAVAVKQIHELILSHHNRSLFEREMDIASRCRHPCLLQFIGATNDEGSPLFVTELMESSLRALLNRPLTLAEISVISLDVARALNYLHQKEPSPIIHRDISSANVLLWRQADQWRGKVSDYGTANFMQHTMTDCPGAMIYSAPEAFTKKQTVKVDVYSFGVLLCEMCIQELPNPQKRNQQVARVTYRDLRPLIRRCLQSEPEARPSMEEIISELEQLV